MHEDEAEATFVPPKFFLNRPALWRIDLLQDLIQNLELVRHHAILE